jgi:hypothetical protein
LLPLSFTATAQVLVGNIDSVVMLVVVFVVATPATAVGGCFDNSSFFCRSILKVEV